MTLTLERRSQVDRTPSVALGPGPAVVMITPALGADYWAYRVVLSPEQAVVGFPKFHTIGIGFAVEAADWNTNLPYTCSADDIAKHIAENKGDEAIPDEDVRAAIDLIREAARVDKEAGLW